MFRIFPQVMSLVGDCRTSSITRCVTAKAEDGLTRILDDIRHSAVSDKPPVAELSVPQDVEMANAVPLAVAPPVVPIVTLDELQPKAKVVPLSMTAFVATGNEHLSPLARCGVSHALAEAGEWNQARGVAAGR